jgi:hypothetical protein
MKVYKPHSAGGDSTTLTVQWTAQLSEFSTRVVCKLARSHAERDVIFKLRYRSYLRAGLITPNSFGRHIEPSDHAANAHLIGLYVGHRLVSSLRLQIGTATDPTFSSLALFPDFLGPLLRGNKTVADMSCVATEGELPPTYAPLSYLVLRSWIVAAEFFHADYIASAIRPRHQLFYKRTIDCELHSDLRQSPHQRASVGLATLNFATRGKQLYENLPYLRSTAREQQQLFAQE